MSAPTSNFAVEQLTRLTTVTGSLRELGPLDLLQAIHDSKRSATLAVRSGEQHVAVYFRNGDIIEAELGALRGERALYGALSWSDGDFVVEFREPERADTMRTSTRRVLWEGRNWLEERARRIGRLPDLAGVYAVDRGRLLAKLAELPDEMNLVLKLFDSRRALREVLAQSELDELSTLGAFARLISDGVIQDTAPSERAPISVHPGMQLGLRKTLDYYEPTVPVILDPPPRASTVPARRTTDRTLRGMQAPTESRPEVAAQAAAAAAPAQAPSGVQSVAAEQAIAAEAARASIASTTPMRATAPPRRMRSRRRRSSGESTIPTRRARTFASSPDYAAMEETSDRPSSEEPESVPKVASVRPARRRPAPVDEPLIESKVARAVVAVVVVALIGTIVALLSRL